MAYNVFIEQIDYIAAVVRALNALDAAEDADDHHYLKVELVENGNHTVVGKFTNEIGPGSWSFEFVDPS